MEKVKVVNDTRKLASARFYQTFSLDTKIGNYGEKGRREKLIG